MLVEPLFEEFVLKASLSGHQILQLINFNIFFQTHGYGWSLCLLAKEPDAALCHSDQERQDGMPISLAGKNHGGAEAKAQGPSVGHGLYMQ